MGVCKLETQMLDESCALQWPCPHSEAHTEKCKGLHFLSLHVNLQNYA